MFSPKQPRTNQPRTPEGARNLTKVCAPILPVTGTLKEASRARIAAGAASSVQTILAVVGGEQRARAAADARAAAKLAKEDEEDAYAEAAIVAVESRMAEIEALY